MFTAARAAISRVEAPSNPRSAKTSSAAARMRAFVDPGASRAFSRAVFTATIQAIDRARASMDDLLAHREANDLGRVVQIELLHDVLAVRLDRVDAHGEHGRDLLVRLALGDQLEHLALAVGEEGQVVLDVLAAGIAEIAFEEDLRPGWAEERPAAADRLHGLQEVEVLRILQQIAPRTRLEALADADVVGVHRQDEDLRALVPLHDLAGRLDAVQLWKRDVHHDDVRVHPLRHVDGAPAVPRLPDDLDLVVGFEDAAQPLAYDRVVIDQEHPDFAHHVNPPLGADSFAPGPISPQLGRGPQEGLELGDACVTLFEEPGQRRGAGLVMPER